MSTISKTSLSYRFSRYISIYSPPVFWALVIFIFSSQQFLPSLEFSTFDFIFKKSAHVFVYAVLYFLIFRSVRKSLTSANYKSSSKLLYIPIIICLAYAISDEIHQSFVPGRFATLRDVGFDMMGVGIAFLKKYNYI